MENETSNNKVVTGKFFTGARRFKEVIGSLWDGTKIPGGPYTYAQAFTILGIAIIGWITRGIWGSGGFGDLLVVVAVAVGAGFLLGRLPTSRRSPLKLISSAIYLLFHPGPGGRWKGAKIKLTPHAQRTQKKTKDQAKRDKKMARRNARKDDLPVERTLKGDMRIESSSQPTSSPSGGEDLGYGSSLHRLPIQSFEPSSGQPTRRTERTH